LFLGYTGLLGALSVLTDLPAALVVAAFALPASLLVAAGAMSLASSLTGARRPPGERGGGEDTHLRRPAGASFWVLLVVPLTFVFLRLPDARASAVVFPLIAFALSTLLGAGHVRESSGDSLLARGQSVTGQSAILAAALGAAVLVHPLGGAFAVATCALVALLSPSRLRLAVAGICGAAVVAVPQAAVMVGLDLPAVAGLPFLPAGLLLAAWLGSTGRSTMVGLRAPGREVSTSLLVGVMAVGVVGVALLVLAALELPAFWNAILDGTRTSIVDYGVLLLPAALWLALVHSVDGWRVIASAIAVGLGALAVAEWIPQTSLLFQSIAYEVPKEVGYWLPWFVAIAGGLGLAAVWDRRDWPPMLRAGVPVAFVILAAIDFQPASIEEVGIEQHRYADSLAISLHHAETGYWVGYPDARNIVDPPRQALLDAVRAEISEGRITAGTRLLHIAPSFQQWAATPLGVFDGVIETDATEDPEHSLHTAGGRLYDVADVPDLLRQGFADVVVEGYGDHNQYVAAAQAAGYRLVWQNAQAVLLAAGS
jgi:hypothetical protein